MPSISEDKTQFSRDKMFIPFGAVNDSDGTHITYSPEFYGISKDFFDDGVIERKDEILSVFEKKGKEYGFTTEIRETYYYYVESPEEINTSLIRDDSYEILRIGKNTNLTELYPEGDDGLVYMGTDIDGKIVSVACENPHYDDEIIEIAVETATEYEGRGFGTSNVAKLTANICKPGKKVLYVCETDNIPSIKIAEKVGFRKKGRTLHVVWYND